MNAVVESILDRLPEVPTVGGVGSSWTPVDLGEVLAGSHPPLVPEVLRTTDGRCLFYLGRINGLYGDSGIGKSWLALVAVAQVLDAGHRAVIIDYEASAMETVARLRSLGCSVEALAERLRYISPSEPTGHLAIPIVLDLLEDDTDLVVIDSLGEAFGLDGIDENSDADVGLWFREFARTIAKSGPAVVLVDHTPKATRTALHASGSKRKRAAITGASYLVDSKKPPTKNQPGILKITCAKDRHGNYRTGDVAAEADITPHLDGTVTVDIHASVRTAANNGGSDEPVVRAAKAAVAAVRKADKSLSTKEIETTMEVKVGSDIKRQGITMAVERGALGTAARGGDSG